MQNVIITAPKCKIKAFKSLFIEISRKNCNLKCKHCYIDFKNAKYIKNFIHAEKIKQALSDLKDKPLEYIHFTGAEPMTHPDFNTILRYCLKRSSVVIHTNGLSINDKKARFFKKIEEENNKGHEIIIKLSLEHYDEMTNDNIRGRGTYRKCLHAAESLVKYGFNPLITIVNHYDENETSLKNKFKEVFLNIGIQTEDINFNIIPLINKSEYKRNCEEIKCENTDCAYGRILTSDGIYNCPMTADDYRGRSGSTFQDYSETTALETPACSYCMSQDKAFFGIKV